MLAGAGFVVALSIELLADRLPPAALPVLIGLAGGLVALALYMRGETSEPFALLFLFPVILAFGFLPRPAAIGVLVVAIASHAAALLAQADPPARPLEVWLITSLALAGVGAAVAWGRARFETECAQLASAARTDPLTGLTTAAASRRPSSWSSSAHAAPAPGSACWSATSTASSRSTTATATTSATARSSASAGC